MVRLYALKIQKKKNYENPTGNSEVDGETVCFENTKKKKKLFMKIKREDATPTSKAWTNG